MVSAYYFGPVGVCAVDGAPGDAPTRHPTVKKNLAGLHAEQSDRLQDLAGWGAAERPRNTSPLLASCAGHAAARRTDSGLVHMAPLASRDRQILALQTARSFISTTVVLGCSACPEEGAASGAQCGKLLLATPVKCYTPMDSVLACIFTWFCPFPLTGVFSGWGLGESPKRKVVSEANSLLRPRGARGVVSEANGG